MITVSMMSAKLATAGLLKIGISKSYFKAKTIAS